MSSYWRLQKNRGIIFIDVCRLILAGLVDADLSGKVQAELSELEALGMNKQVPAMGGIGLLALGLSMLGLGAVRSRKRH